MWDISRHAAVQWHAYGKKLGIADDEFGENNMGSVYAAEAEILSVPLNDREARLAGRDTI